MEDSTKLSELIPVKVTKAMADDVTEIAGGERKRAEYIRGLIEKDRAEAKAATRSAAIAARVAAVVEKDPTTEGPIDSLLSKLTRRRFFPAK